MKFDLIKKTIEINKMIKSQNLGVISSGNASIKISDDLIAIKPSGIDFDLINEKNISLVDLNGRLKKGFKPSSDLDIHLRLFNHFKDLKCVIHTHSHFASVFAILNKDLEVLSTFHADFFGKKIECLPFINHRTQNIGDFIIKKTKKLPAIFLVGNHGIFVLSNDPDDCIKKAIALEEIAKLNYHSLLLNKKVKKIKDTEIEKMNYYYKTKYGQK
ncbi:MAG: class II aldolase/adducin family protein [Candidatus Nanoarchaeia archaeon]|nr:class II aldolase/adducin family protein [Candidatus Nanoarchaeia archaeon]